MAVGEEQLPRGGSEYATKADLEAGLERVRHATKADLEAGLERVRHATKADLEEGLERVLRVTKADLEFGLERMQHAIELLAEKSQTDMANLRADMADRHNAMMRWIIGFIVAVIVMLAALGVFERIVPLFIP